MKKTNRNILIAISVIILIVAIYYFFDIVSWLIIAWILSLIGQPMMRLLERVKIGKLKLGVNVRAILTLLSFFIVVLAFIALFVPSIIEQARNLAKVDYTKVVHSLDEPISQVTERLINLGLIEHTDNSPTEFIRENLIAKFSPAKLTNIFGTVIGATGNLLVSIFSIIFITFFFLKDKGLFMKSLLTIMPSKYEAEIKNIVNSSIHMLTRYFGGILIQVTIVTIYLAVLLGILGIPSALLIAFFAALINVIPYVGPMIGGAFGIFIIICSDLDVDFYTVMLPHILKLIAVFVSMQMLDNFLVQPYVYSNSVMAHPLEIFIIVLVGAKLGGIPGMVLAIPLYTICRVIASVFLSEFRIVQSLTEGLNQPVG